ncbi:MAG: ABC transporter substrate-binding protein, partial [Gammaproteobacteria bacterium]|nr:ABC transporter substrate-binding protein [Gammaproteobacteria bacterium]
MSEEKIKLGLMPPLTGLVGIYGSEIAHAGQVACQEINDNGGVLGRPLEVIIEDDGSLPESAVIAAERLLNEHKCHAIIGNLLSNSRIAVAYRVAEPRRVPYLNFSFYEGSILSRYFFNFAAVPNQQIDKMIPYMYKNFGARMFFAGNNYEWPRGSIHAGKLALEQLGGEVVGEEYTSIGVDSETIDDLLDKVEAAKPDVFVPYFAGNDQVLLLTRFTERGMKKQMAVVMGHYDEMMASQLPPEVREGFYSSNTYFMSIDSEKNRNYKSRLATLPDVDGIWPEGNGILTNFGEGTYACVKAFAEAANKAGTLDPEVLVETLRTISFDAPQGTVTMQPEHHHATVNTFLTKCDVNGVFNIVEKFGAIAAVLPDRYNHQRINNQATVEDDIRLQARMLEQLSEGILLIDTNDESILYANSGSDKLFGYDKGEMFGLEISDLNDPTSDISKNQYQDIIPVLNQKGEWEGELHNIRKDGSTFICSTKISIFTHPVYGEVWLAIYRDITDEYEMKQNLQRTLNEKAEEAEKNRMLFDMSPIGLALTDMNGKLLDVNQAYADIMGRTIEECYSLSYWDVTPEKYADEEKKLLEMLEKTAHYGPYEKEYIHVDGHLVPVRLSGMILKRGDESFIWSSVENISDIKIAEMELKKHRDHLEDMIGERTKELRDTQDELVRKERLATLGQLTATVSHELRNPLGAMRPSLYIIEKKSDKEDERLQKAIARVDRNIDRCDRIIDELLDFTRITNLNLQPTRIDEWLESVINEQVIPDGITLETDFSLNDFVMAIDSDRLRRAIINVMENASHSMMDDNQQMVIRSNALLKIKTVTKDNRIEIVITDTGSGITKDVLDKIFVPLFSTKGFGVGLGMPTVRQIMQQH